MAFYWWSSACYGMVWFVCYGTVWSACYGMVFCYVIYSEVVLDDPRNNPASLIKHVVAQKLVVFWILLILTTVEVLLGIYQPPFMLSNYLIGVTLLNMTFIILTIIKAYYIVGTFMHLGHEVSLLASF